jgi:non-specific serine/threonine protein kinase
LLDTLDAMRTARPNDARHAVARYRELLKATPERVSGRVEPVMDPVPPAAAPSRPPEPEPPPVDREVDLSQAVAVAMRQAKNLHSSAPPRSAARSAAAKQARFTPPLARLWSWGGAAVLGLAFGVAGWKLSEQIAAHTTAATLARASDQSTVVAAAHAGGTGERAVAAPADAAASPAIEDVVARAPSASGRPQGAAADEARSAGAAREVATTSVAATAAAVAPTERAAPSRRVVAQAPAPTAPPPARGAGSPREECGARTNFALYRCMQMQCSQPRWSAHAHCVRLRATDEVG